jgi:hypothetical protein
MLGFHQSARLLRATDSARRARTGLQRLIEGARSQPAAVNAPSGRTRSVSRRSGPVAGRKARALST